MRSPFPLLAALTALLLGSTSWVPVPAAVEATEAMACRINIRGSYDPNDDLDRLFVFEMVLARGGSWSSLSTNCSDPEIEISPGDQFIRSCNLTLDCKAERRYKFKLEVPDQPSTPTVHIYHPSFTSWTDSGQTNIRLGNVASHLE